MSKMRPNLRLSLFFFGFAGLTSGRDIGIKVSHQVLKPTLTFINLDLKGMEFNNGTNLLKSEPFKNTGPLGIWGCPQSLCPLEFMNVFLKT